MNKTAIGLGSLVLALGVVGVFASDALAYRGDASVKGPRYSPERHEAMTKAFEKNDYAAWKNLAQGRAAQVVTEQNFAKFAQAHALALEGKTDEAQKIRQELGLGMRDGSGAGMRGMGRGMHR